MSAHPYRRLVNPSRPARKGDCLPRWVIVGRTATAIGTNDGGNEPEDPTNFFFSSSFFLLVSGEELLAMSGGDTVFD
jgi:hypothetical protein